jgi:hypothetical protein
MANHCLEYMVIGHCRNARCTFQHVPRAKPDKEKVPNFMDVTHSWHAWQLWTAYCLANGHTDPFCPTSSTQQRLQLLLAFAACTHTGNFGQGRQVQVRSVTTTIRYVEQTFELAGYCNPHHPDRTHDLNLVFTCPYSTYHNEDRAPQPMITLLVKLFSNIATTEGGLDSPLEQAIADLVTIVFFFLLRFGDYTCPTSTKKTPTRQFQFKDVTFWSCTAAGKCCRFPFNTPPAVLMVADTITLILSNQKNVMWDAILHHNKMDGNLCPVKALARHCAATRATSNGRQKAMICQYGTGHNL